MYIIKHPGILYSAAKIRKKNEIFMKKGKCDRRVCVCEGVTWINYLKKITF